MEIAIHGEPLFVADDGLETALSELLRDMREKNVYYVQIPSEMHKPLLKLMNDELLPIIQKQKSTLFNYTFESVRAQRVLKVVIAILLHIPLEHPNNTIPLLESLIHSHFPVFCITHNNSNIYSKPTNHFCTSCFPSPELCLLCYAELLSLLSLETLEVCLLPFSDL